ncbi:MAG: sulfotransferase [Planctomycetota bacterium]
MADDPKPNLIIAGAPKCGTTSLHHYLDQHPEVFMCRPKEPHHFGRDLDIRHPMRVESEADYLKLFASPESAGAKVRGDASTWYLYSKQAAQEIQAFTPDAKIVVMLREPASYINSLHLQALNTDNETILSLEAALAAEPDRLEGRNLPEHAKFRCHAHYRASARFAEQVQRYVGAFGRDRVFVALLDDMKADLPGLLRRLFAFLDIDPDFQPTLEAQNTTRALSSADLWVKRLFYRSRTATKLVKKAPKPVLNAYRWVTSSVLPSARGKAADEALMRSLREEFAGEVRQLADVIHRDLSAWAPRSG